MGIFSRKKVAPDAVTTKVLKLLSGSVVWDASWDRDFWLYLCDKHPLLSICFCDTHHPYTRCERIVVEVLMLMLAFFMTSQTLAGGSCYPCHTFTKCTDCARFSACGWCMEAERCFDTGNPRFSFPNATGLQEPGIDADMYCTEWLRGGAGNETEAQATCNATLFFNDFLPTAGPLDTDPQAACIAAPESSAGLSGFTAVLVTALVLNVVGRIMVFLATCKAAQNPDSCWHNCKDKLEKCGYRIMQAFAFVIFILLIVSIVSVGNATQGNTVRFMGEWLGSKAFAWVTWFVPNIIIFTIKWKREMAKAGGKPGMLEQGADGKYHAIASQGVHDAAVTPAEGNKVGLVLPSGDVIQVAIGSTVEVKPDGTWVITEPAEDYEHGGVPMGEPME